MEAAGASLVAAQVRRLLPGRSARRQPDALGAAEDADRTETAILGGLRQEPTVGLEARSDEWVPQELAKMMSASLLVEAQQIAVLAAVPWSDVEPEVA
jgi:hypothetical protein